MYYACDLARKEIITKGVFPKFLSLEPGLP